MLVTTKIWAEDEAMPEGLFNKTTLPNAPPNWFREDPVYAAELYGLERGTGQYNLNVLDDEGNIHHFKIEVVRSLTASIQKV